MSRPSSKKATRRRRRPNRSWEHGLLAVEERRATVAPPLLRRLGLTRREAEVLVWVSRGKTNGEIGMIVGSSRRTVEKHVERILRKLSVETRTAAAALALQAAQQTDWCVRASTSPTRPPRRRSGQW